MRKVLALLAGIFLGTALSLSPFLSADVTTTPAANPTTTAFSNPLTVSGSSSSVIYALTGTNTNTTDNFAQSAIKLVAGTAEGVLQVLGPNYPTTGVLKANMIGVNTAHANGIFMFVDNASGAFDVGIGGSATSVLRVTSAGAAATKLRAQGTAPTMGACGTSPSVTGGDSAMIVTVGTGGAATSCAVTFAAAWSAAPACVAQNNTDRVAYSMVTTTTTLTISAAAAFTASSKFHVHCIGVS